ncbi:ferredoxin [Micromonospora rifamycinica]|uniref:ferredoxin n=1 Tax=Micromonospora rifamycinica TaxID=291594 RepID=UPI00342C5C8F
MTVSADRSRCAGAGQCVLAVPEVFDQDDEDGLVLVVAQPGPGQEGAVSDAVRLCPSGALSVVAEARPQTGDPGGW